MLSACIKMIGSAQLMTVKLDKFGIGSLHTQHIAVIVSVILVDG